MDSLRTVLKKLLSNSNDMIDNGDCDGLTNDQLEKISMVINLPQTMGREDAAKFLGVSLNKLHGLIHEGIVSPPRKVVGFKELHYYRSDLKKSLEKLKNK